MHLAWAALAVAMHTPPAGARTLSVDAGYGDFGSRPATALFLRYRLDAVELFRLESFCELSLGRWNGTNYDGAIGIARGVRWSLSSATYVTAELGVAAIRRTTQRLGTRGQLLSRIALGRRFGKYAVSVGQTHYSNGKEIFRWRGPNLDENFVALELERRF